VANTRKISAVVIDGRWLSRQELEWMLRDLARRNATALTSADEVAAPQRATH
jgi:hypothetical protein